MKSLFSYITLASIILSGGALAEEVVGKWGTKKFYGFAEYGILSSDFNLNTTVTSGTLAVTSNVDSQGSIGKLGFGLSLSEKSAVELYAGKVSGISGTTTITAPNAVIDGVTYNGSLSAIEDITADLIGINLVASDSYRFLNDSEMYYFGRIGLVQYDIKDELRVSGTGTVGGVTYNASTPVLDTLTEKSTSISLGGGVSYNTQGGVLLSAGLDYIPNVGGKFITESNITTLTFRVSKAF